MFSHNVRTLAIETFTVEYALPSVESFLYNSPESYKLQQFNKRGDKHSMIQEQRKRHPRSASFNQSKCIQVCPIEVKVMLTANLSSKIVIHIYCMHKKNVIQCKMYIGQYFYESGTD